VWREPSEIILPSMSHGLLAAIIGFTFWFGMLYPLIPTTLIGWVIEVVAGIIVAI